MGKSSMEPDRSCRGANERRVNDISQLALKVGYKIQMTNIPFCINLYNCSHIGRQIVDYWTIVWGKVDNDQRQVYWLHSSHVHVVQERIKFCPKYDNRNKINLSVRNKK